MQLSVKLGFFGSENEFPIQTLAGKNVTALLECSVNMYSMYTLSWMLDQNTA